LQGESILFETIEYNTSETNCLLLINHSGKKNYLLIACRTGNAKKLAKIANR